MLPLDEVIRALDSTLDSARFTDYCHNGLQVEGTRPVRHIVTGVSAHAALFDRALAVNADLVVVHHGLFWGPVRTLIGPLARRVERLLANGISLAAYHLPLDAHPTLGNNAGLGEALGVATAGTFGDVRGIPLGVMGKLDAPMTVDALTARVAAKVTGGRAPFVFGPRQGIVTRVGWCTGAASDMLEAAAQAGCDAFVTGELAERAGDMAKELGIGLIAAGHYATEVYGPARLAGWLGDTFGSRGVTAEFIDCPSAL